MPLSDRLNPSIPLASRNVGGLGAALEAGREDKRRNQLFEFGQEDRTREIGRQQTADEQAARQADELRGREMATRDAIAIKQHLEANDAQSALGVLNLRRKELVNLQKDTTQTDTMIQQLQQGDIESPLRDANIVLEAAERFKQISRPGGGVIGPGTAERFFGSLTEGLSPERVAEAELVQLGLQARAGLSAEERIAGDRGLGESVADQQAREATATTSAKAEETRLQGIINDGQEVADGLPVLRRSLELLDVVATGGKLREAQLSFAKSLGIETADQGEISANLGKAVLSQLRATFGAQFTEKEGDRLIAIEAGFGKNNNTNRRLLGQAIKIIEAKANRAIKLARSRDDEATAQIIEDAMRMSLTPGQNNVGGSDDEERLKALGL